MMMKEKHEEGNSDACAGSYPQIFILSTPRSGSTLLRYILDTHPAVCSPGELNLGATCANLISVIYSSTAQAIAFDDKQRREIATAETRSIITSLMTSYAKLKGKAIWCEKTPRNLQYLDTINKVFPDSAFICLYRNCMDYIHSCIEFSRFGFGLDELWPYVRNRVDNTVAAIAESWIDQTKQLIKFERQHPSSSFRIKYESIVLQPSETLKPLFDFLKLDWDEGLLERIFTSQHEAGEGDLTIGFADSINKKGIGKGSKINASLIPKALLVKVNALLGELGYPIIGPDWNSIKSPYLLPVNDNNRKKTETVDDVFSSYFPNQLERHHERLKDLGARIRFQVTGGESGVWIIDLTKPFNTITTEDGTAACTITVPGPDLIKMANGEINPVKCFMKGEMRIGGNVEVGIAFGQVIFSH